LEEVNDKTLFYIYAPNFHIQVFLKANKPEKDVLF